MIDGFRIGHMTRDGGGWLTGCTVVAALDGAVGGVDVRGGGPGTRETDLLNPTTLVERVNAVLLTGGSAYGLAAADGVMTELEQRRLGFPVGPEPHQVVPIVPAAVLFDLGRGGVFGHRPSADFGREAVRSALGPETAEDPAEGTMGAGTGANCGGLKGGFGYAQTTLASGVSVGAAVAVNAAGSAVDERTGRLWADRDRDLPAPNEGERRALREAMRSSPPSLNTTIGVLLTDATLTKPQASRLATVGHDGMARAITPIHSMSDGDSVFALASGLIGPPADPYAAVGWFNALLDVAAQTFTRACLRALLSAEGRGPWPAYRDLVPAVPPPGPQS